MKMMIIPHLAEAVLIQRQLLWRQPCQADACEIYTDVDGVYTADPRKVPTAKKLDEISYDDMLHMALNGAQVLHSRCVEHWQKNLKSP